MAVYPCPKGHNSTDDDYCSDCGTKIDTAGSIGGRNLSLSSQPTIGSHPVKTNSNVIIDCPDCTTPHDPNDGIFCEICGYNFKTKAHGEIPIEAVQEPIPEPIPTPIPAPPISPVTTGKWQLEITIDPSLAAPESPPPPNQGPIIIALHKPMSLIGRTSDTRANYPEVALDFDEAVSHRHAVLNLTENSPTLRDIGSSNGTYVNGIEIKPMVDISLKTGDIFNLGHWTKVTIRSVP
jgi:FHA domain